MVNTSPKIIELNVKITQKIEKLEENEKTIANLKRMLKRVLISEDIEQKSNALKNFNSSLDKVTLKD